MDSEADAEAARITPACAGKSLQKTFSLDLRWDHPRMRGEKGTCVNMIANAVGSPPHARGKGSSAMPFTLSTRITPACAGKSETASAEATHGQGSPPHARGKVKITLFDWERFRITPACAGKRIHAAPRPGHRGDHPRMRGEKLPVTTSDIRLSGSPPHARGKGCGTAAGGRSGGITPACAGKSIFLHGFPYPFRDHPRMRGEKGWVVDRSGAVKGSPPHARGKVTLKILLSLPSGITPACAGKSDLLVQQSERFWDHPRMRGEKTSKTRTQIIEMGSPPHARGKAPP